MSTGVLLNIKKCIIGSNAQIRNELTFSKSKKDLTIKKVND